MQAPAIGANAGWQQVLPILAIDAKPAPMPLVVRCPQCDSLRMRIYNDTTLGGHWHYCPTCKASGDMIGLAARTWKCNLTEAVSRLAAAGVSFPTEHTSSASIQRYEEHTVGVQVRCQELLEQGAEALAMGQINPSYIIQQLGLLKDQDKSYWRHRMGRFMTGATCNDALSVGRPADKGRPRAHKQCKFAGGHWGQLIGIPFHDLPRRFMGYLYIGRQARPGLDYEFFAYDNQWSTILTSDIGACMYEVMDTPTAYTELFGNTIFVFNDPIHALKLQSRHMRDSDLPLPLIGTYNAKLKRPGSTCELVTRGIWTNRPDKTFIFWSPTVSPDVFNNAARADAPVYICKSLLVTSRNPGHIWLQQIQRQARPWAEVLEAELLRMPASTACDFLAQLSFTPDTMQAFRHGCCDKLQQLMASNQGQVRALATTIVHNKEILETSTGWSLAKTGETISNIILRVDKIVSHDNKDDPYYVGRLICGEKEATFSTPYSAMYIGSRTGTLGNWLHNNAIRLLGKAPILKYMWEPYILDIARQFHEPQVVAEDGRFGWKPRDMSFSLPQFSVCIGGNVSTERAHVLDDYAPGTKLWPPTIPPPDTVKLARECLQNELYWAMMACIGANVVAPALGHPLANIAGVGHIETGIAYTAARLAGCATVVPSHNRTLTNEFVAELDHTMHRHNWPIIVQPLCNGFSKKALYRWLNSECSPNGITVLPEFMAMLAPVIAPWRFINIPAALDLSAEAQHYGDLIMPLWLQRLCTRKLELESDREPLVERVLDDMAAMMEDLGGNGANVRAAIRHIDDTTGEAGYRLVRLLYRAITDGVARYEDTDSGRYGKTLPKLQRVTTDKYSGIFLSGRDFGRILGTYDLFTPSPGAITDALTAANALDCRCEYNGESGWLIVERWWHQQIARCRASHKRLTVIGGA